MSDDKTKHDGRDSSKINTHEEYELNYWSKKWNVTKQDIIDAVKATGSNSVKKIADYLGVE